MVMCDLHAAALSVISLANSLLTDFDITPQYWYSNCYKLINLTNIQTRYTYLIYYTYSDC